MKRLSRKQRKRERVREIDPRDYNDLCPYIFACKEPFCFNKFGNYYGCLRYITKSPRLREDQVFYYDGWSDEPKSI